MDKHLLEVAVVDVEVVDFSFVVCVVGYRSFAPLLFLFLNLRGVFQSINLKSNKSKI